MKMGGVGIPRSIVGGALLRLDPPYADRPSSRFSEQPGPNDPEPSWHQVADLPKLAAIVTEPQAHARTCPACGLINHATIPDEVRAHVIGPRLAAWVRPSPRCQ